MFKIKTGYYLELLATEKMKLLGCTKSKIAKNENGENLPYLEITEVVLAHCNIVINNYQQNSRVLHTFVAKGSFGKLLNVSPKKFILLKSLDSEFSYIEVWLEIDDKINIALVINESITFKSYLVIQLFELFSSTKRSNICKRLCIFVFY